MTSASTRRCCAATSTRAAEERAGSRWLWALPSAYTGTMHDGLKAAALLLASNTFMTCAWYGHLRFRTVPMLMAIVVSWGIAFFEYCFQVPANRIGYHVLSAYQLKVLQEVITLTVFMVFAALWLG